MSQSDKDRWFLAQVKPNCQRIAQRNLARQGFGVFLPVHEETVRSRGRFTTSERPLFPGYVFVSFNPDGGFWRKINSTHGIARLVRFGSAPTPVPQAVIAGLTRRCDGTGKLQSPPSLSPGDRVSLIQGPFSEFLATVESLAPDQRVWVLLDLMGRQSRVSVGEHHLRRA